MQLPIPSSTLPYPSIPSQRIVINLFVNCQVHKIAVLYDVDREIIINLLFFYHFRDCFLRESSSFHLLIKCVISVTTFLRCTHLFH